MPLSLNAVPQKAGVMARERQPLRRPISTRLLARRGFAFFASSESGNFFDRRSSASFDFSMSLSAV